MQHSDQAGRGNLTFCGIGTTFYLLIKIAGSLKWLGTPLEITLSCIIIKFYMKIFMQHFGRSNTKSRILQQKEN